MGLNLPHQLQPTRRRTSRHRAFAAETDLLLLVLSVGGGS
jgi:hypothetical protein